jgi:hypothetical protein
MWQGGLLGTLNRKILGRPQKNKLLLTFPHSSFSFLYSSPEKVIETRTPFTQGKP